MVSRRGFGSVRKLPSGRWQARYRDPEGELRPAETTFATKADADAWLATTQHELRVGDWIDPDLGERTLESWALDWMDNQLHLKPKTRASYESLLLSRVLPELGHMALVDLRPSHIQAMVSRFMTEGVSASRTRQCVMVLSQIMKAAVADGLIRANPCLAVKQPRLPKTEMRVLTSIEVERVAAEVDDRYRILVYVLAYCGLRWGEAIALTHGDVDLAAGRIRVVRSLADVNGHLYLGSTKTYQQRSVVVPTFLRAALAEHMNRYGGQDGGDLVFAAPEGNFIRYGNFIARQRHPALEFAGVERTGVHILRHTCASLLVSAGAPIKAIQAQLGHSSAEMTLSRYSHLYPDDLDILAERLDSVRTAAALDRLGRNPGRDNGVGHR
jgi:integrase